MPHETYTHGHSEAVLRAHAHRTGANSAAHLLPHLAAGQSVLDVGCGAGTITRDLAALVAPGRVVGVDREAAVIDVARETVGAGEHGNITFEVADAYALPSTDGTFDVVHCHQVLHHLGDPVAGLREMARVARPGGLVSLREADFGAFTWYPELPGLASWMDLFQQVARHNGGEPNAGRRLLAWVHAADLTDVTPSASLWLYATPDDRADWGESWAERVTTTELADQAVDLGIATRSDLAAMAATWRTWAADPDGWLLLPHAECLVRV